MNKLNSLARKRWLKKRRREKKIKKQVNYYSKNHKGTTKFDLKENLKEKKVNK